MLRIHTDEPPIGVQIFGSSPEIMAKAGAMVEDMLSPLCIDINAGCPKYKVIKQGGGGSLLKKPDTLERVVRSVVDEVSIPVTVKIRSGFDRIDHLALGEAVQSAGASAITLHPRTVRESYAVPSRRDEITQLKKHLDIPVVGSGDVLHPEDALDLQLSTGCDGVMVARGMMGYPWFAREALALMDGRKIQPPSWEYRFDVALRHSRYMVSEMGEHLGIRRMRKHLFWYMKGHPLKRSFRDRITQAETLDDMGKIVDDALGLSDKYKTEIWH